LRWAEVVKATNMSETFDCDQRAWDYLSMAEAETDQTLKALLFDMWRNWLLLGQLEQIDAPSGRNCGYGSMPRVAPGFFAAWVFKTLVLAEARGEWIGASLCRAFREFLYERIRRQARAKLRVHARPQQTIRFRSIANVWGTRTASGAQAGKRSR
jgi:hypothetical protein